MTKIENMEGGKVKYTIKKGFEVEYNCFERENTIGG